MAFEVNTYSPSEIGLEISGYRITGFEKISISRNSTAFSLIKGIRGKNSRQRNRDSSCSVVVNIIQTSLVNDVLTQILEEDIRTNSARLTLNLTDGLGSSKIVSRECFIESYPDLVFSDNISMRRWNIICLSTDIFRVGGNSKLSGSSFSDGVSNLGNKFF
jgi:hypothetical protein